MLQILEVTKIYINENGPSVWPDACGLKTSSKGCRARDATRLEEMQEEAEGVQYPAGDVEVEDEAMAAEASEQAAMGRLSSMSLIAAVTASGEGRFCVAGFFEVY